jgi:hypothetical protein
MVDYSYELIEDNLDREHTYSMEWENMLQFADFELGLLISEHPDRAPEISKFRENLTNGGFSPDI